MKVKLNISCINKLKSLYVAKSLYKNDADGEQEIRCIESTRKKKVFDYFDKRGKEDYFKTFSGIRFVILSKERKERIEVILINFYVLSNNGMFQINQDTFVFVGREIERRLTTFLSEV
jgi:lipopolysaccharide biosynthesis glycosyltransferase